MEFRKLDLRGAVFVKADAVADINATRLANTIYDKLIKKVTKVELVWVKEKLSTGIQEGFVIPFRSSKPYVNLELMLSMRSKNQLAAFYRRKGKPDLIILNIVKRIKLDSILRQLNDPNSRLSFVHEFVHHLDAKKFKSKTKYMNYTKELDRKSVNNEISYRDYYNLNLETNTHYSEIIHKILEDVKSKRIKLVKGFPVFLKKALGYNKEFIKNLSDKNLRRLKVRLYQLFKELTSTDNVTTASEFPEFALKDGPGTLLTVDYLKGLGKNSIANQRKEGLKSWGQLKKSNLFPSHSKPPEGFLKACQAGIYITAENGDQWHTYPNGIRGYSAVYVTPFEISPMQILDSSMKPITLKNLQYGKCKQCEQD